MERMELRKLGMWMVGFGLAAQTIGLLIDAIQHADDPALAQRQGIFDLSSFPHALFFAGIALAILGVVLALFGPQFEELYAHDHDVTVSRRLAQVLAPVAAVALIAGCAAAAGSSKLADGTGTASAAGAATATDAAATAADGHTHSHSTDTGATTPAGGDATTAAAHAHGTVVAGSATGNSPCEKASPTPASPGQVGAGSGGASSDSGDSHGDRGLVVQQPLTQAERGQLEQQMTEARTVVAKYPTVKDAEAAGYAKSTPYVPCIGAHYTNIRLVTKFDPTAPSELLYDGTNPDSKLVGLSYLVYHPGGAPDGFAGPNDHWHQHNANGGLCMKGGLVVGGESMSEETCTKIGGAKRELTDIWMMHAWVVPGFECTWGAFSGECPELGGRVGGSAWDAPAGS